MFGSPNGFVTPHFLTTSRGERIWARTRAALSQAIQPYQRLLAAASEGKQEPRRAVAAVIALLRDNASFPDIRDPPHCDTGKEMLIYSASRATENWLAKLSDPVLKGKADIFRTLAPSAGGFGNFYDAVALMEWTVPISN
ncbi:hypothetical protein MTO96_013174 [Rhipicephalus appendiculatus]